MPGKRITELTAIAGASTANDDNLVIFDTSEGTTKRILRSQLAAGIVGDLPYTPAGFIAATTVPTAIAEIASDLSASSGSSLVGFVQSGTGAVTRTTQAKLRDFVSVKDFGAVGDGVTDDTAAIQLAFNAITDDGIIIFPPGTYKVTSGLLLGQLNKCARLYGIGQPTIKFYSLSATTDCLTMVGANYRQMELKNIIIDCNSTGRDGVVLTTGDSTLIDNVIIKNAYRDGFAISCADYDWVENAEFALEVQSNGRHGVRMQLSGTNGAFINECLWRKLEIRGVSKVTAGGRGIFCTSTATSGASKFSNHLFLKSNIDAQYTAGGGIPIPSLNIIETDSGVIENWRFLSGGWENTGATSLNGGYAWAVSGTGMWNGLTVDNTITNSFWGNLGVHPSVSAVWNNDFSFGYSRLHGPIRNSTGSNFLAYLTTTAANQTGDGTAYVFSSLTESRDGNGNLAAASGVFTAPYAGMYRFNARAAFGTLGVAHTNALLQLVVTGSTAGTYNMSNIQNPYDQRDGGNNCALQGSIDVMIDQGETAKVQLVVNGGAKTVGVIGGATQTYFSGQLVG